MRYSLSVIIVVVIKEEETGERLAIVRLPLVQAARTAVVIHVYLKEHHVSHENYNISVNSSL